MRVFCWVYILSVVIISPLFLDLYPFSVFPMFSENVSERLFVDVTDEQDNPLDPQDYGLLKVQIANGHQRYGYDLGPCYFDQYAAIEPCKSRHSCNSTIRKTVIRSLSNTACGVSTRRPRKLLTCRSKGNLKSRLVVRNFATGPPTCTHWLCGDRRRQAMSDRLPRR